MEKKVNEKGRPKIKGGEDRAPMKNTLIKKGKVGSTPKGKGKERGPKLVNQNIKKFLTHKTETKGTEIDTPVGNKSYVGENKYGCRGVVVSIDNSAKLVCYKPDTGSISNNKRGGE